MFKKGDRLLCILGSAWIKRGEIYTFSAYCGTTSGGDLLKVEECKNPFYVDRFEAVKSEPVTTFNLCDVTE